MRTTTTLLLLLSVAGTLSPTAAGETPKKRWEAMDYGPFISGTFVGPGDNYALRGVIVCLDKEKQAYACYDTETMRLAFAWTGGFIDYNGVVFNTQHHAQPKPKGTIHFATKPGPGWADSRRDSPVPPSFADPRKPVSVFYPGKPDTAKMTTEGQPMPAEWMKYKGLYLHGDKVVLSYRIGDCDVLERPGMYILNTVPAFTRDFSLSASSKPLTLAIVDTDGIADSPLIRAGTGERPVLRCKGYFILAMVSGEPKDSVWAIEGTRLVLRLPALAAPVAMRVAILNVPDAQRETFQRDAGAGGARGPGDDFPENPAPLIAGGPARWTQEVKTIGVVSKDAGPYVLDTLTLPDDNPWKSWMRMGGFDFFPDGKSAALCTWSGDVWIVSGIDESLQNLSWKRFATGLYQPLGLKIVDGKIYCTCRDQITRLHDLNNDGEADFYENFNSDSHLTRHFHEFTMDLQTDAAGNFYFAKGGTPGRGGPDFDLWSVHNGCFFKLSPDGRKLDVVARGLRAPNGIGIGPNGEMVSGDNEGSWVPSCPINWITPGGSVGIPDGVPFGAPLELAGRTRPTRDFPICWLPKPVDNSGGGQVWVTSDKWGPFKGHMLHLSYGKCALFNVMTQDVPRPSRLHAGETSAVQGGVARFPLLFPSGSMRARFNPADGQLYVCGLKGWQTDGVRDGMFQRVRYTGAPVHMPLDLRVTKTAVEVTFTQPLDKASAGDAAAWGGQRFNVKWTKSYGSKEFSVADPNKIGRDELAIQSARVSDDGRTATLQIEDLKPVTNMILKYKLKAADGTAFSGEIYHTIHALPE